MSSWPTTAADLVALQESLARLTPAPWTPQAGEPVACGCFVCFARGGGGAGAAGDPGWAGAAIQVGRKTIATVAVAGPAGGSYAPGLLALREGPLLEAAVREAIARSSSPLDLLLVNATGLDHPRGAGLAVHLGWLFGLPTIGVTDRPLVATPAGMPGPRRGDAVPLSLGGRIVGFVLRTRPGARPVVVHAGWRVSAETAAAVVVGLPGRHRTPGPLRTARAVARGARAAGVS